MVLPGRPGGRVGRRRDISERAAPSGGPFSVHGLGTLVIMPEALRPRTGGKARPTPAAGAGLPRELLDDLRRTTRPGDQRSAASRLSRAIELLERGDPGA